MQILASAHICTCLITCGYGMFHHNNYYSWKKESNQRIRTMIKGGGLNFFLLNFFLTKYYFYTTGSGISYIYCQWACNPMLILTMLTGATCIHNNLWVWYYSKITQPLLLFLEKGIQSKDLEPWLRVLFNWNIRFRNIIYLLHNGAIAIVVLKLTTTYPMQNIG